MFRLDGRVVLLTGAAGGLGEVMALSLAQLGASLALVGRNTDKLTALARRLADETGATTACIDADIANAGQARQVVARSIEALGRVDILVNNAGVNFRRATLDFPEAEWRRLLDINLSAPFFLAQAAAPGMIERRWGRIINVSSMLGRVGLAARPAYTATKGGLEQLTRTLALEWATYGVTVNALAPGPFMTAINEQLLHDPVATQFFIDRIPLGRWGQPWELSAAIAFLASDASSFMTGSTLVIDGGWTAQ